MLSINDKDYQALSLINNTLVNCNTRAELNQLLKITVIPFLNCSGAFYVRMKEAYNSLELLDSINLSLLCQFNWQNFLKIVMQTKILKYSAIDSTHLQIPINVFQSTDPNFQYCSTIKSCYPDNLHYTIAALFGKGRSESIIGLYFCNLQPQHLHYNSRDFKLLQLLRPVLLQTIKTILANEKCSYFQQIIKQTPDYNEPFAVVRLDGTLVHKNQAFDQIITQKNCIYLPTILSQINIKVLHNVNVESHHFQSQIGRRIYNITLKLIKESKDVNKSKLLYFLRFSRITNHKKQILRKLTEAGLTQRELEIAALILKGNTARAISEEINLSYHTIRNHIRNIYSKMGVSNRIEMLNWTE
ncbi:response regulator transcription factor [Nitrosomonas aestuarii]|uniref:response regulator transcription factor n=1 Tax=Nitrosomonas aestuarii TaxID=52441 RepID=UPI000D324486|nr:helix-turn-helix transcriptional regulator [Nitrosomonas aestuarii]PTN11087.1 regulatory LuxR family protein [Nitrosomonas aestuarii]